MSVATLAATQSPPYYAVIFTSILRESHEDHKGHQGHSGYARMAEAMAKAAARQPGFLGVESAREEIGITVSYWDSLESIAAWKNDVQHLVAQRLGREQWYRAYRLRVCRIERDSGFGI